MLQEMKKSSYLLVCASEPRHVPGKLFEYLKNRKTNIAFGDDNEEVKKIITEANAGMMFKYNEDPEEFFNQAELFSTNMDFIKKFDRKNITEEFARILMI